MTTCPQSPKKEQKNQDDLLRLIEDGNAEIILSPENARGFNELIKYELICLKNEKICLTELGKKAKSEGAAQVLSEIKAKTLLSKSAGSEPKNFKKLIFLTSVLLLVSLLIIIYLLFF